MKYLCLAYYDVQKFEALPKPEFEAIAKQCPAHDEELRKSGHLLFQASLGAPHASTTIRPRNGKPSITDGPFTETKEQVGGFFMIDARDLDEALAIAARIPMARRGTVEVRPVIEITGLPTQ